MVYLFICSSCASWDVQTKVYEILFLVF